MPSAPDAFSGPTLTLRSPRLTLEPLQTRHADELFDGLTDPALYLHLAEAPPRDLGSLTAQVADTVQGLGRQHGDIWCNWIIRRNADRSCVGTIQASIEATLPGRALIGIMIFRTCMRQGLATDALTCVLDCLFGRYACHAADALVDTENTASLRMLAGLGFEIEGMIPDAGSFDGRTSDEYALSLERVSWQQRSGAAGTAR